MALCIYGYLVVIWLVGWLVGWLVVKHRKVNQVNCGGGKLAQSAKYGQRETRHISLRYTITM